MGVGMGVQYCVCINRVFIMPAHNTTCTYYGSAQIEKEDLRSKDTGRSIAGPLDPLLLKLARNYSDHNDLDNRLRKLFTVGSVTLSGYIITII